MRERLGDTAEKRKLLGNGSQTFTGILGPDGKVIAGPAEDDTEAIVYASIDLDSIIRQKIHHDVAGNYNRFDVLSLALNRTPLTAITELPALSVEPPTSRPSPDSDQRAENGQMLGSGPV